MVSMVGALDPDKEVRCKSVTNQKLSCYCRDSEPTNSMYRPLVTLFLILFPFLTFAQQELRLRGVVLDQSSHKPIPFAAIQVEGKPLGTVTNADGQFELLVADDFRDGTLVFSYLGYQPAKRKVSDLEGLKRIEIRLEPAAIALKEVVIDAKKKKLRPKRILRNAIEKIPSNYANEDHYLEGYYRETTKEHGVYIKFADAACKFYQPAYTGEQYKHQDLMRNYLRWTNFSGVYGSGWLHSHFDRATVADAQVQVFEARASDNHSREYYAMDQPGGPLGITAGDKVRYRNFFLNDKFIKRYDFTIKEEFAPDGKWLYVIDFSPKQKPGGIKIYRFKRHNLSGTIWLEQESLAFRKIHSYISGPYKEHICGNPDWGNKHFGHSATVEYQKVGDRWYLKHMLRQDEFTHLDTVKNMVIPYNVESELWVNHAPADSAVPFPEDSIMSNTSMSILQHYPLHYDSAYWNSYAKEQPLAVIEADIRKDMEKTKTLEAEFRDKHIRKEDMEPPVAKVKPDTTLIHGYTLVDDYAWLKDTVSPRHNQEVMNYLDGENAYFDNYFIPLRGLQRQLYREMVKLIKPAEKSLPVEIDGFHYYTRWEADKDYPIYCRRKGSMKSEEEILMDVNKKAENHSYYSIDAFTVSPNGKMVIYTENTTGRDNTTLRVMDLTTRAVLPDSMKNVSNITWVNDNKAFYYALLEKRTNRSYQIRFHRLGTPVADDPVVMTCDHKEFGISIARSRSRKVVVISESSGTCSRHLYASADSATTQFEEIVPLVEDHANRIQEFDGNFYLTTNKRGVNFSLVKIDPANPEEEHWEEIIPHDPEVLLEDVVFFDDYIVVSERFQALTRLRVINRNTGKDHYIEIKEDLASLNLGTNLNPHTQTLRLSRNSFKEPGIVLDYNMKTRKSTVIREDEVMKELYNPKFCVTEQLWAEAPDGVMVPVTILYRKYWPKGVKRKVYMTGYGSYGAPSSIGFPKGALPLINRGWIYAIAHVRGGSDLGWNWYEDGKMEHKKNSFSDFVACTEKLIAEEYTDTGLVVAQGGSAGGLLMGGVANLKPELYGAIVLDVPFVDVINTMLDDKLPLTTGEYREWGNPNEKEAFDYMMSYSPYDNVEAKDYPNLFFFSGLNDTRVGYWEPAKMIAKLRAHKTDDNLMLLKMAYDAGHGGGSGRYAGILEASYKWALLIDLFIPKKVSTTTP